MGDQTNPPERIKVAVHEGENRLAGLILSERGLLPGYVAAEYVDAAAYDRVVAERDEARAELVRADEMLSGKTLGPRGPVRSTNALVDRYIAAREITSAALSAPSVEGDGAPGEIDPEAAAQLWRETHPEPAAGVQSTTETATGDEYSLIDAVLPAKGKRRAELIRLMIAKTLSETTFEDALISAYDVLREAAAPATPEGPDA